ncbi:MAG: cytochrome c biogenesis protein [Muribaculaceae bacterium]|nr:cytochrome c biogenesis protein [Muribaculaceae bacterium]
MGILSAIRHSGCGRLMTVLILILATVMTAKSAAVSGIPRSHADSLASRQVVYDDRVVTFSTVSHEVMMKLYGEASYRGMSAEQAVASMILYPDEWKSMPLMKVGDAGLRRQLGLSGKYASMTDLFDAEGRYRLDPLLERTAEERERRPLLELDEKAGLMILLWGGMLFEPYDADVGGKDTGKGEHKELRPLSPARVRGEIIYNRFPAGKILFILLFSASAIGFLSSLTSLRLISLGVALQWIAVILATWQYGMIWWLGDHIPLGTMQDTLLLMVVAMLWLLSIFPLLLRKGRGGDRLLLLRSCGWLACGAFALVAWLNAANPAVTPLSPMLASPWLSIHVTIMMISYALLVMCSAAALAALLSGRGDRGELLHRTENHLLWPGVLLLAAGIFTGAAWASTAWGRWWAWDPKEVFALVSLIAYSVPLVPPLGERLGARGRDIYLIAALLTILMTYFGVNYLPSIHAYTR